MAEIKLLSAVALGREEKSYLRLQKERLTLLDLEIFWK